MSEITKLKAAIAAFKREGVGRNRAYIFRDGDRFATALSYLLEEIPCACLEDEGECSGCKKLRKIEKMMGEK